MNNENRMNLAAKEFKSKAIKKHGSKYDYSLVNYTGCKNKVDILCNTHNKVFHQIPNAHLTGNGCPECKRDNTKRVNAKRIAHDVRARENNFITQSRKVHSNKYDYLRVHYINASTPVIITCPIHGEFRQLPLNHRMGRGCLLCGIESLPGGYNQTLFDNHPEIKDTPGYLYIAELKDTNQLNSPTFLKVGITNQPPKYRLSSLKAQGITSITITRYSMTLFDAFIIEQQILQDNKSTRFYPITNFGGYTECLKYSCLKEIQLHLVNHLLT